METEKIFAGHLPAPFTTEVSLQPVQNGLMHLALLTTHAPGAELEPWMARTAARLTPEQRQRNRLAFEAFAPALLPAKSYPDFPAYLDGLAAQDPAALRERTDAASGPAQDEEVRRLLADPPALQALLVDHLRQMWETVLAGPWQVKLAQFEGVTRLMDSWDWQTPTPAGSIRKFIRRPIPDPIAAQIAGVERIVFVPAPYIRLHASRLGSTSTLWIFVIADHWALPLRSEPIQRSEVLGPLRALGDDTRLQLLELLAYHTELSAQELVAQLEVSQPTISRHMKQLVGARIVAESRGKGANKRYRLQPKRLEEIGFTLQTLLSRENAGQVLSDVRRELSPTLAKYVDRDGLLSDWPAKIPAQREVLAYLASKFDGEERYSEAQVNEILNRWHTFEDPVHLRRELIDFRLLARTTDGSVYWKPQES